MHLYSIERALKDSLKKFITLFNQEELSKKHLHYLILAAVRASKPDHLKYILFGEFSRMFPQSEFQSNMEAIVDAVRLQGREVFDVKDLNDELAKSDSIEIFQLLQAFNYPLTDPKYLVSYTNFRSLNILSYLLKEEKIRVGDILKLNPLLNNLSFELLVLFNTREKVTIPRKGTYFSHEDSRKQIFEEGQFDRYNYNSLLDSILQNDIEAVKDIIPHITMNAEERNTCFCYAFDDNSLECLNILLDHDCKPTDLLDTFKKLYHKLPALQLSLIRILLERLKPEVTNLLNEAKFVQYLLSMSELSLQYIFKIGILQPTQENMYAIINVTKPDRVKSQIVFLYSLGFPIQEINSLKIDSVTSRERIKPLLSYFSSLVSTPLEIA